MKVIVDLEDALKMFENGERIIDENGLVFIPLWCVKNYLINKPNYDSLSITRAEKHPNFKQFVAAYATYKEQVLKARFKMSATDGKVLNEMIDDLLFMSENDHAKALQLWHIVLIELPKLNNDFLTAQTFHLTSFRKFLAEIITKIDKNNGKNQSNSGTDATAKKHPRRHSKYAKPEL